MLFWRHDRKLAEVESFGLIERCVAEALGDHGDWWALNQKAWGETAAIHQVLVEPGAGSPWN